MPHTSRWRQLWYSNCRTTGKEQIQAYFLHGKDTYFAVSLLYDVFVLFDLRIHRVLLKRRIGGSDVFTVFARVGSIAQERETYVDFAWISQWTKIILRRLCTVIAEKVLYPSPAFLNFVSTKFRAILK